MSKRFAVVLVLTLTLVVGFVPRRHAVLSNVLNETEIAAINETAATEDMQTKRDGGNRFVKVITAPFKAIGRLFGRGSKKDDNKLHRLSEKDVKKFESSKVARVTDARTIVPAPTTPVADPTTTGTATESEAATLQANQAVARQHLQRALELFGQNDINGAINSLSMAVSLDRELWDAHNLLGVSYELKGLRSRALESLETALQAENDQPEHLNDFGYILMKHGEYARAIKYLKRAVKAQPDNQRFLNNLGLAQIQIGKFDEAYKNFEIAMGEFEGRMNIIARLIRLGQDKEAIKHLERCREMQPNRLDILYRLAVLYGRTGRIEEAAEANKAFISHNATAAAPGQQ